MGDSGGPLYINGKIDDTTGELSGQTLAGIHSGALGCGHRNAPAWWQRVSTEEYVLFGTLLCLINIFF